MGRHGVNHEPMDKNQIEGDANQSERARNREAFVTKGWWRKPRLCDEGGNLPGRSRLTLERATGS